MLFTTSAVRKVIRDVVEKSRFKAAWLSYSSDAKVKLSCGRYRYGVLAFSPIDFFEPPEVILGI